MGQLEMATKCYREGYELSAEMGDEVRQVDAEEGLAKVMVEQGEIAASLERYEQIIKARRRMGYRSNLMNSLSLVLVAQTFAADYQGAETTAGEALELHYKSGDLYRVPFIKYYQAFGELYQGELGKASENLEEGLRLAHEQKQKSWQALGMAWLSYYYLILGFDEEGLQQAQQSNQIAEELGSPLYVMRAQSMLGTAYRHLNRLGQATEVLENVHSVARSMGFAPDEVMILYQLIRVYMDTDRWDKAEENLARLLALATASEMKEFVSRSLWLQAQLNIHHQRYDQALENLVEASSLAEQSNSRLSQYIIQTQKSQVYHLSGNSPASRDAMAYAQKLQKRLAETLPDEPKRHAFYNNQYAVQLQEMIQANTGVRLT
jgi:tetratricopeptide (TPR) repeat protein